MRQRDHSGLRNEVAQAVEELLAQDIEALCVCCIFSYADDKHGKRIADVVQRVLSDHGVEIPVPLSSRGARTILFEQCHHRGLRRRQKSRATRRVEGTALKVRDSATACRPSCPTEDWRVCGTPACTRR
ncbi:hydantoinase/oxoprolinase N-terminal domain-containing protein [Saccharomonospora viridis]|uniref:hydantoinase/oxoprolinase N-terminal domain-containing protein n=1 Tax=Saccharomonospora viridis TaxID=1852 RepID=UPI003C6E77D3